MKSLRVHFILCLFFIVFTSCEDDVNSTVDGSFTGKTQITGTIQLPTSASITFDQVELVSIVDQQPVESDGTFTLNVSNEPGDQVVFLNYQDGKTLLMGYLLNGEKSITISAASTAKALLMLHPNIALIQPADLREALRMYQKHPLFTELVEEIERLAVSGLELLNPENTTLVANLGNIWNNPDNARKMETQEENGPKASLIQPTHLRITGSRLALTYVAGIYNPMGELVNTINFNGAQLENTSAVDWFISIFDDEKKSFSVKDLDETIVTLKNNGDYTIRMRTGFAPATENSEEDKIAFAINASSLLTHVSEAFKISTVRSSCIETIVKNSASRIRDAIVNVRGNSELEILVSVANFLFDALGENNIELYDNCVPSDEKGFLFEYIKNIDKFLDVFERGGAAANAGFMAYSLYKHNPTVDFCVTNTETEIYFCGKPPVNTEGAWVRHTTGFTYDIYKDAQNNLWFGAGADLVQYSEKAKVLKYSNEEWFEYTEADGLLPSESVLCIYQDSKGHMWFGTDTGVSKFRTDGIWESFSQADGLVAGDVGSITEFQDSMWFSTEYGISVYKEQTWRTTTEFRSEEYVDYNILHKSRDNQLWIGAGEKLYSFNGSNWEIHPTGENGMLPGYITDIGEDSQNSIWISVFAGVSQYKGGIWTSHSVSGEGNFQALDVTQVFGDNQGRVWIGSNSYGIHVGIPGSGDEFEWKTVAAPGSAYGSSIVLAIEADKEENIWFGSFPYSYQYILDD